MKPITVQLPPMLMDRVKNLKARTGMPIQRIIALAITEFLDKNGY
ncbi:Ribbon-helix-helix protein, CopG [uncultured Caudovirales phage]|uniref:Ribbon-helix-helix protein, CopG n=1 Tax=uncultured Caudovirales phage TaxID=2100421 RepID=A0A6J5LFV8_9CAUD|nr:Ribbon-helix-helix protein, CopG [uncultured Caudovirales phage]